jgi:hypothetical protein
VQQAETESDDPWVALRQTRLGPPAMRAIPRALRQWHCCAPRPGR